MSAEFILETQALTKEFKGFVAVDHVDLRVRRGSIHALIGPNGAGKTTCFNLLTKFLVPTSGTILFDGIDITSEKPAAIARRGVVRSFQISAVFAHLSVLENVRVALQRTLGTSFHFWKPERSLHALDAQVLALLREVDLEAYSALPAVELSYGRKRALEIATTLAMNPTLMLLDEPTQGMGLEDVDRIRALIKKVAASRTVLMVEHNMSVVSSIADTLAMNPTLMLLDEPTQGMGLEDVDRIRALIKKVAASRTVLMVEHNMSVVSSIADTITVLARGATLAEGPYAEVSKDPAVIEAYMGSAQTELVGAH